MIDPNEYDPFEMRMRRALSDVMDYDPDVDSSAQPVDLGEPGGYPYALSGTSRPMSYSEQTLFNMKPPEYTTPSGWARAGAALSGLGAGLLGRNGAEVANEALAAPYRRQMMGYQQALDTAQRQVGLEHAMRGEEVARQRAAAYQRTADARMRTAEAMERWRHAQEMRESQKLTPFEQYQKDPELFTKFQQALHPEKPVKPDLYDQWKEDPEGVTEYLHARYPDHSMSLEDKMALQENAGKVRAKYRAPKAPKPVNPSQVATAEHQALTEMSRDPKYSPFIVVEKGKARAKTPDELPKSHWYNNTNESLIRENYNQFLSDLAKRKQSLTGGKTNWEEVK